MRVSWKLSVMVHNQSKVLSFDNLTIDFVARMVFVDGRETHLTRTEFDLLSVLSKNPRRALSRAELATLVWGEPWFGDYHVLTVHIANLRKKIKCNAHTRKLIQTIHGYGYRFDGKALDGQALDGQALDGYPLEVTPSTTVDHPPVRINSRDTRRIEAERRSR